MMLPNSSNIQAETRIVSFFVVFIFLKILSSLLKMCVAEMPSLLLWVQNLQLFLLNVVAKLLLVNMGSEKSF